MSWHKCTLKVWGGFKRSFFWVIGMSKNWKGLKYMEAKLLRICFWKSQEISVYIGLLSDCYRLWVNSRMKFLKHLIPCPMQWSGRYSRNGYVFGTHYRRGMLFLYCLVFMLPWERMLRERASLQCLSFYPGLESSVLCRSSFGSKIKNWKGVGLMVKDSLPSWLSIQRWPDRVSIPFLAGEWSVGMNFRSLTEGRGPSLYHLNFFQYSLLIMLVFQTYQES